MMILRSKGFVIFPGIRGEKMRTDSNSQHQITPKKVSSTSTQTAMVMKGLN